MKALYTAALGGLALLLSHQATAIPLGDCADLPSIVRLGSFEDPAGTDQVNSISNSCIAVGWAEGVDGTDYAAIWADTNVLGGPDGIGFETPDPLSVTPADSNSSTDALDIDGPLVLIWFQIPANGTLACCYTIFDILTDTYSAPFSSEAVWTHTPQLTNSAGWTIEYGTNWDGFENAFIVQTPEPSSGSLSSIGVGALLVVGLFATPQRFRVAPDVGGNHPEA